MKTSTWFRWRLGVVAMTAMAAAACSPSESGNGAARADAAADAALEPAMEADSIPEDRAARGGSATAADPDMEVRASSDAAAAAAAEDPAVHGRFGAVFDWPVIPIHVSLLPDGRVLGFGGNADGSQGTMYYAVWDPTLGTSGNAMLRLPNQTNTNVFCAGAIVQPSTGDVLIFGGDRKVNSQTNYGTAHFSVFRTLTSKLERQPQEMALRRWYPAVVTLHDGKQLILGGRASKDYAGSATEPPTSARCTITPELYDGQSFRTLTGAKNRAAFGPVQTQWNYPRAFLAHDGRVFEIGFDGSAWWIDPTGDGSVRKVNLPWPDGVRQSMTSLPTVVYAPGKMLSLEKAGRASVIDFDQDPPLPASVPDLSQLRMWGNATVQADGKVFVSGGSTVYNEMTGVGYRSETWDPATWQWTAGAVASRARLYHSVSILLPDGTIMTGGGGAPGPQLNANAEIYYPPYLFKADGSGNFAPRPVVTTAPSRALGWNEGFDVGVVAGTSVSRVTFVKTASVTHSYDSEQRLIDLPFTRPDNATVRLKTPAYATDAPPGYYLLFVFDSAGVPSIAKIVRLMDTGGGAPTP